MKLNYSPKIHFVQVKVYNNEVHLNVSQEFIETTQWFVKVSVAMKLI